MAAKQQKDSTTNNEVYVFPSVVKMSKHQPTDVKRVIGRNWLTNGVNNIHYKRYRDAYDDSPTNSSIINAFVNYINGDGLIDKNGTPLNNIISEQDVLLICQDYKIYGGFSVQIIWSLAKKPLKIEYIPIYKLGVNFDNDKNDIDAYWFSWDWANNFTYRPVMYPAFEGSYKGDDLEVLMVRRPTAEPFFPLPDYLPGLFWAEVEGQIANAAKQHFINSIGSLTVINYNSGKQATPELARTEAKKVRDNYCGTDNESKVIVSFNEGIDSQVIVDQLHPPELNQQNVFFSEEAERKLIVAHSAPPVLFSGSNSGNGFSSNADEIAVATKGLYRRHINPMRRVILGGLQPIFDLMELNIELDFKDFIEEKQITTAS
jgi:hypothetical protein